MAAVFDGRRVSAEWHIVLTAARAAGVRFKLNSGQRTMREQARLYSQNMNAATGRPKPGRPLTARPNPNAPHIRVRRPDHALDVDALDGGANRFDAWCTAQGFPLDNTVADEAWHKEIRGGAVALRRFASKLDGAGDVALTRNERKTLRLITELRGRDSTPERRAAIRRHRRTLRDYRARIRAAAAVSGWGRGDRRRRYLALGEAL